MMTNIEIEKILKENYLPIEFEIVEINEHTFCLNVFDTDYGKKLKNFVVIDIQNKCIFSLSGWMPARGL